MIRASSPFYFGVMFRLNGDGKNLPTEKLFILLDFIFTL
jgi:hypothetical protein